MWILYALLSAFFAALTSVLAKIGIENINSNLATAVRTAVILAMTWITVFISGTYKDVLRISSKSWLFLILSGLATGASWLFYFKALQTGSVSKVAPIDKLSIVITLVLAFFLLGEKADIKTIIGCIAICAGTIIIII